MPKTKRNHIKDAVLEFLDGLSLELPLNFDSLIESKNDIVLVPYTEMISEGASYKQICDMLGKDAAAAFNKDENKYVIFYNDLDQIQIRSNRVRFTIAHEIGHIALGHLKDPDTKVVKDKKVIHTQKYFQYETEANKFAAYLIVPHAALVPAIQDYCEFTAQDLQKICKISDKAAEIRYGAFNTWLHNKEDFDSYDSRIFETFGGYLVDYNCIYDNDEVLF